MAMKYQRGTVYPSGQRVKMWYGKYLVYRTNQEGKEVRSQRNIAICPKAKNPKWKAQQLLQQIIMKEGGGNGVTSKLLPDDSVTFAWFVKQRYIAKREGKWSPAYKKSNAYELEHFSLRKPASSDLDAFEIQIWLNQLAEKGYSEAVVGHCFTNIRAITRLARKLKFLSEDPAEDLTKPQTEPIERPVMTREQSALLLRAINDMHDLCLLYSDNARSRAEIPRTTNINWPAQSGRLSEMKEAIYERDSSILKSALLLHLDSAKFSDRVTFDQV